MTHDITYNEDAVSYYNVVIEDGHITGYNHVETEATGTHHEWRCSCGETFTNELAAVNHATDPNRQEEQPEQ